MKKGEAMLEACFGKEERRRTENFLKGYGTNARFVRMDRYEREYFQSEQGEMTDEMLPYGIPVAKAKMFEVRHFILELPNCDEKLLLYYHFVRGETVERCGEMLGVSRSSAFRLKKRALAKAFLHSVSIGKNLSDARF